MAEAKLFLAVQEGHPWAVTFALRTVGRQRGYGDHVNLALTIERAAAKVAAEFDVTPEEVLHEARRLLQEVDNGTE